MFIETDHYRLKAIHSHFLGKLHIGEPFVIESRKLEKMALGADATPWRQNRKARRKEAAQKRKHDLSR